MHELPPFKLKTRFKPEEAWHDKVEWKLSGLSFPTDSPAGFFDLLVYPSLASRKVNEPNTDNGWLFSPSANYRAGYVRSIRRSKIEWGGYFLTKPLISGRLRLRPSLGQWNVQFDVESNPTRLFRHHPRRPADSDDIWLHESALSENAELVSPKYEFSFDGNDNWVPQMRLYERGGLTPAIQSKKCIRLIEEAFTEQISNALASQLPDQYRRYVRSLDKLETYWEFAHDDPTRLVASLENGLREYSQSGFIAREYRGFSGELEKNSLCLHVQLARGETLVVYSKTNRRVRFEIRQNFHLNAGSLGGRHTANTRKSFLRLMEMARIHCAARMNKLFSYLSKNMSFEGESVSTAIFLSDLARTLSRSDKFADILALLLTHGKLTQVQGLESDLRKLKRAKIIETVGSRRGGSYTVVGKYRKALAAVRQKGLGSEFGARDR